MTVAADKNRNHNGKHKEVWDPQVTNNMNPQRKCNRYSSSRSRKAESVLSTDSDIRFTRRKLKDSQKCGCAVIAGFLVILLLAGLAVYIGYTFLKPEILPERVFRGKFRIIKGDQWSPELADQSSIRFQHKIRDYRERINLIIRRSDLRDSYEGCEVLALDGNNGENDLIVHFNLNFDPYRGQVSVADLHSLFANEIQLNSRKYFSNLIVDSASVDIWEVTSQTDIPATTAISWEGVASETVSVKPQVRCEPLKLPYCKSIGYNATTYPNLIGHNSIEEVLADVITFREIVDAECFRQAYDFVCRLLQPPCLIREPMEPASGQICREYCTSFWKSCSGRVPERFKKYFDCDKFPESTGVQSCQQRPGCAAELQSNALSNRLCDGIPDCPDLSDETACSFCAPNALYCGRGRACISRSARCNGKIDCPDGADEKDCLSISPLVSLLTYPPPLIPHRPKFFSEGFTVFSEKGETGKLCAQGLESAHEANIRKTVAQSLCKSLGYEKVLLSEIRKDNEPYTNYVRVLDPHAQEISFVRTECKQREALYVACDNLECGIQSALPTSHINSLPKMAAPGDWPWHVVLLRDDTHLCDGTLISENWVLTTESCFQGQSKAIWIAVFGSVRLNSNSPWTQRRRVVGMVKSPVEGSTAALVRLENPVIFSDFVRPICLPDEFQQIKISAEENQINPPHTERLQSGIPLPIKRPEKRSNTKMTENTDFFIAPISLGLIGNSFAKEYTAEFSDEHEISPRAQAMAQYRNHQIARNASYRPAFYEKKLDTTDQKQQWPNCNTLGWSKQRDHLQRVQLKISNMASCENASIATVNSMCTEAAYHKQDCTEEEFAGSPVICMLPDGKKWALVGVASWRIACAQVGIERPRMYDKIAPNSVWIRDTINAE